ncbi:hypothetical protein Misp01_42650 [Microtetraspora sp. NBRC 13810]|nr:hypothetical protein Misp01_42650 [Microtetraspora sp. NBRC 13810]
MCSGLMALAPRCAMTIGSPARPPAATLEDCDTTATVPPPPVPGRPRGHGEVSLLIKRLGGGAGRPGGGLRLGSRT